MILLSFCVSLCVIKAQNHSAGLQKKSTHVGCGGGRWSGLYTATISNKTHTLSSKATNKQYLVVSSLCRVGSRSIHLCSSWPALRSVNTCGSAPWRATPSSDYGSQPQAGRAAATSHDSDPASDSGRAQGRPHSCFLLIKHHIIVNTRWLSQVVVASTRTSIWRIMCHMK